MGEPPGIGGESRAEIAGRLLVGAVLNQASEQQIAFAQCLETLLVMLILLATGQDGHAFGLHQNRSNIQERTGLVHVLREVKATHISQEFLGD